MSDNIDMSNNIEWLREAGTKGIGRWGREYGTFEPLAKCLVESADLLEANAAEIERLRRERGQWCETASNQDGLLNQYVAENEKLRAVYEAVNAAIKDEHEQGHNLDDLTPLWADVEQALAAVEQSEAVEPAFREAGDPLKEGRWWYECLECGDELHQHKGGGLHLECGQCGHEWYEGEYIKPDTQSKGSPDAWIPRT